MSCWRGDGLPQRAFGVVFQLQGVHKEFLMGLLRGDPSGLCVVRGGKRGWSVWGGGGYNSGAPPGVGAAMAGGGGAAGGDEDAAGEAAEPGGRFPPAEQHFAEGVGQGDPHSPPP